jgi:hypothetical protein
MGFLDSSGKPTPEFSLLKNSATAKFAIADGVRTAYKPLYEADENVQDLAPDQLKGTIAQVSGAEEGVVRAITGTFNALVKIADFTGEKKEPSDEIDEDEGDGDDVARLVERKKPQGGSFSPSFRFNVEVHLPSNGTEETYLAIFNALRKALG